MYEETQVSIVCLMDTVHFEIPASKYYYCCLDSLCAYRQICHISEKGNFRQNNFHIKSNTSNDTTTRPRRHGIIDSLHAVGLVRVFQHY